MEMLLVVWTGLNAITTMITVDTDGRRLPTDKENKEMCQRLPCGFYFPGSLRDVGQ